MTDTKPRFGTNLSSDWPRWCQFREMRSKTSHTYDEDIALEVVSGIPAEPIAGDPEVTGSIPNIEVKEEHWNIVRNILQKHLPDFAVWAFGSRVRWSAKPYSDLDLAIMTNEPLPLALIIATFKST